MRLWSIHPKYLDTKGLVALWRESLLAQHVLLGKTRGYTRHPQLRRFKSTPDSMAAIGSYLRGIHAEAEARNYHFDQNKIGNTGHCSLITVTEEQVEYELNHLINKLKKRSPERHDDLLNIDTIEVHPLFNRIPGNIESWEVVP